MSEDKDIRDLDVSEEEGEDIKGGRPADVPGPMPPVYTKKKSPGTATGSSDVRPGGTATGTPGTGTRPAATSDPKSPGRLPPGG